MLRARFFAGFAVALVATLVLTGGCASYRMERGLQRLRVHPVRDMQYWGEAWRETPLAERVAPATAGLVEYLLMDNELWGYPLTTESALPPESFSRALASIEAQLSEPLRAELRKRLIGVFAVRGLGSSGYAETVRLAGPVGTGHNGIGLDNAMFIVLDVDEVARRTANEWATWKESTFWKQDETNPVAVRLDIETAKNDTTDNAVRFILLHEIGHVLGLFTHAHPGWDALLDVGAPPAPYRFPSLSWTGEGGEWTSRYADVFPDKKQLAYYVAEPGLDADGVRGAYERLLSTNLPSLYGLTSMWEDFAESFATYVHVVRAGRPYRISVERGGEERLEVLSCWADGRCPEKRVFFDNWFAAPMVE